MILSHTWVRYPGFSGHGVKCPIFDHGGSRISRRSDWLYHSEQMGPIWASVPCQKKYFFVCETSSFRVKESFPKGELVL